MCNYYRCFQCGIEIDKVEICEYYYIFNCRTYLKYILCINCRKLQKQSISKQD